MSQLMLAAAVILMAASACGAQRAEPLSALARMPVKEVTVFKDGHAFVLHEGAMPVDSRGNVQMDYLPAPVLGTYWPYSGSPAAKLTAVTSSPRRVLVERTAMTLRELLDANPGAQVTVVESDKRRFSGKIVGVPTRSAEELMATNPPNAPEPLPVKSELFLLKTADGVTVLPMGDLQTATFRGDFRRKATNEEFRNLLTLKLDWPGGKPARTVDVGMMYLQKGLRWIPGYKAALDGKGGMTVKLQATLINELTDLSDVTANLVVGVPTFAFKDTLDPIGAQQTLAQLSSYFQQDSRTGFGLSNAIMSQSARMGEARGGFGGIGGGAGPAGPQGEAAPRDLGPEIGGTEKAEDLFVFTARHVTLKRGERMVLPVAEYTLKYRDVYVLEIPFAPPTEVRANVTAGGDQQAELARLLTAPKAIHKVRFTNTSKQPLTTAPALIVSGDRVLGQGMMTYTAPGAETDLSITTATDIRVKKEEKETARVPNAVEWQNARYGRVDMQGTISLTNYGDRPADLEVTRYVAGNVDKVSEGGKPEMVNVLEDSLLARGGGAPSGWWGWYNWPWWWTHFNGIGRFTWNLTLQPGKSVDLSYAWHYFWQ